MQLANLVVLFFTLLAILWYSRETSLLRQATADMARATREQAIATRQQAEIWQQPCLVFVAEPAGLLCLVNAGGGPALNVRYHLMTKDAAHEYDDSIPLLLANEQHRLLRGMSGDFTAVAVYSSIGGVALGAHEYRSEQEFTSQAIGPVRWSRS